MSRKKSDLRRRKPIRFCLRLGEFRNRVKIEQRNEWRSKGKNRKFVGHTFEIEIVDFSANGTNIGLSFPVLNIKVDRIQLLLKQRIDLVKNIINL